MDGFETNEGVILLAATNRPDVLDPALLRPGRFDRRVVVDMPDMKGRLGILKVHTRKIPVSNEADLEILARGTPGMSGADLANMVNEAALLAARRHKDKVDMEDFDEAKDKVLLGPERKSRIMKEDSRRMTAYHEAGHAVVGSYLEHADPLHKVTIIPRGRALGVTFFLPTDDRIEYSKEWCLDTITHLLGGRVAEELVLKRIGTGAANDIKESSKLVRRMVMQWGMSDELGPISFGDRDEQIFLGKEIAVRKDYSEHTAQSIDDEVKRIVLDCFNRAKKILNEHEEELHRVANALLERESLDSDDIHILLSNGTLPPAKKKIQYPKRKPESEAADENESDTDDDKPNYEPGEDRVVPEDPAEEQS
jgi:cell division protease FtsH